MADYKKHIFAENLKEARGNASMTQKELAALADVAASTISSFENPSPSKAEKLPNVRAVMKLAAALDVSIDWLCGNTVKTNPAISLISVIESLNPVIEFERYDDSRRKTVAKLVFNYDSSNVSSDEIRKFLEEYLSIIKIRESGLASKEMIMTLEKKLLENYKYLPGLPDYNLLKQKTTPV
ncbi:MAG TPA: hypothetical protein DEB31_08150 [Clostridiales bacterium]|nr:hypothetical protein [Clostridiales bacterium]